MDLPGGTKTKTGQWSTGARVLEELAEQGHALPRKILDWRQVSKLHSTYTEALPDYVNPDDPPRAHLLRAGRHQHRAAVVVRAEPAEHPDPHRGRPQDPPRLRRRARHEAGLRRLFADRAAAAGRGRRRAGVAQGVPGRRRHPRHDRLGNVRRAGQGHADARCAGAPRRSISASSTASRRSASPTSSASTARKPAPTSRNISSASPASATTWTRRASSAATNGYVRTLFGRKCHYPDIKASNPSIRSFNERAAINARLQGTAADIIRRAMIRIEPELGQGEAQRADAAAGARRADLRGAGRAKWPRPCRWSSA